MRVISLGNYVISGHATAAAEPHCGPVSKAKAAHWERPQEILARYPTADILPGNRVVFNIRGNHYRLIVKIHYNTGIVYIRFVGTHAEYDRIDAETI